MAIEINSRAFWQNLVTTIQIDAAEHLHVPATETSRHLLQTIPQNPLTFNYTYAPTVWDWSTHTTTVVNHNSQSRPEEHADTEQTEEQRTQQQARTATLVGTIVGLGAAFATGILCNDFFSKKEIVDYSSQIKEALLASLPQMVNRPIFADLYALINARNQIDARNYENVRNQLISTVVALVGAISAVAGGVMVYSALITAGYIAMIGGALFFLLNLGLHWRDEANNKRVYQAIVGYTRNPTLGEEGPQRVEGLAEKVSRQFLTYTDQMLNLVSSEYLLPQYEPLYPVLPRYEPVQSDYQAGHNPYIYIRQRSRNGDNPPPYNPNHYEPSAPSQ